MSDSESRSSPPPGKRTESPISGELGRQCARAIRLCRDEEWSRGLPLIRAIVQAHGTKAPLPSQIFSFLGYAEGRFDRNLKQALALCRHAVRRERHSDNYYNLARVYLLRQNRRLAFRAIERGLTLNPRHGPLVRLRRGLGRRRPPVIGFLSRGHFLNRKLGKLRARREGPPTQEERGIW